MPTYHRRRGPAGLSAALVLARACRTVLMFDHGQPRNAATRHMHGFLSREGIPPGEFLRIAREDLKKYDTVRLEHAEVVAASCKPSCFEVTLSDGRTCRSRKLLVATGVEDNVPDVPGLRDFYGKSIFHCPFCDGWELRGGPIAVYGRGRRGHGLSMEMLGWSHDLVLCTDGPAEIDPPHRAELARNGIAIREERVVRLEGRDGQLERVVFDHGDPLPRRALFFTTGQHQASPTRARARLRVQREGHRPHGPARDDDRVRTVRRRRRVTRRAVGDRRRRGRRGSGVRDGAGPDQRELEVRAPSENVKLRRSAWRMHPASAPIACRIYSRTGPNHSRTNDHGTLVHVRALPPVSANLT